MYKRRTWRVDRSESGGRLGQYLGTCAPPHPLNFSSLSYPTHLCPHLEVLSFGQKYLDFGVVSVVIRCVLGFQVVGRYGSRQVFVCGFKYGD